MSRSDADKLIEQEPRTYNFRELNIGDMVSPYSNSYDFMTAEEWVKKWPHDVIRFWNSPWIKKPKEPLRAEFEAVAEEVEDGISLDFDAEKLKAFIGKRARVILEVIEEG